MRFELLYNPRLLCERLAEISIERRRVAKLRGTIAEGLSAGHIDSLELLELLRPLSPKVIFDVGANVGTWTQLAKSIYPESDIHAFEPLPVHIEKFKRLTKDLSTVRLHEIGLGSKPAQLVMKVTDFSDASSLLALSDFGRRQWSLEQVAEIPVPIERLDDWVSTNKLPSPDLIKLDVQGYELEALRGAERSLAQSNAVLLEASFRHLYEGQCRFDELVSFLAMAGFFLRAIGHGVRVGRPLLQADLLFTRGDLILRS